MIVHAAIYRLIAELACITGVVTAAFLAYHDKSAWVWGWFLLFGFTNIITGHTAKSEEKK